MFFIWVMFSVYLVGFFVVGLIIFEINILVINLDVVFCMGMFSDWIDSKVMWWKFN